MGQRRRYTRQFKLEALELARTSGKSQTEIERDLGLYGGQLSAWKQQLAQDGAEAFPGSDNLKVTTLSITPHNNTPNNTLVSIREHHNVDMLLVD